MSAAAAYVNPFAGATAVTAERIDQGVDYALRPGEPIKAIGDAIVRGILPNWYEGQPYLWYQLTSGPAAGKYVYVAEQINPTVRPGQTVKAGQTVATYASSGTGIEMGFATASGATLAKQTGGYSGHDSTAAGVAFSKFIEGLGAPGGKKEGSSPSPSALSTVEKALSGLPILGPLGQALSAGTAASEAVGSNVDPAGELAEGVANTLIGWVKPKATEWLLYVVFILGGVVLAGYGLATMLRPTPPSIKAGLGKVAKAGAVAAA